MATKTTQEPKRWTRDYVFDILRDLGIRYIFGVPGTNEIPIIDGTSYPENEVEYTPGYEWQPKTTDPDYLRLERPLFDFVALAKALGGQEGEVVQHPSEVGAAVRRGIDHVLKTQQSYILDLRTAQATPAPPPTEVTPTDAKAVPPSARYSAQPPLDVFHGAPGSALRAQEAHRPTAHVPLIF